jgi:hypothetical protein
MRGKITLEYIFVVIVTSLVITVMSFTLGAAYRERNPLNYKSPVQLIYKYEILTREGEVLNINAHTCILNEEIAFANCLIYEVSSIRQIWQGYATSIREVGIGK